MKRFQTGSGRLAAGIGVALLLIAGVLPLRAALAAPEDQPFLLGSKAAGVVLRANGSFLGWSDARPETLAPSASVSAGEIRYAGKVLKLENPATVRREKSGLFFTYRWPQAPDLEVVVQHRFDRAAKVLTWTREFQVKGPARLASDLTVCLESGLAGLPAEAWLPRIDGVGATLGTNEAAAYRFAGAVPEPGAALALPMISVPAKPAASAAQPCRTMLAADPYFSVRFAAGSMEWTYPARGGLENGCEQRTLVVCRHPGSSEDSLGHFFQRVLADVPPGPKWLHEIALADYDYMSDGGQGWYRDLDALAAAVPKGDRHQVIACLHGWYDYLGRYSFDARTGKLDREWTAFSSYETAKSARAFGDIGGDEVPLGFGNCKPVKMSLTDVHARLRYARERGFRVALYFADGVNAGEGLADFDPARVLRQGGWQGPDSKGRSYFQNPLHPQVRAFFLDYTKALLAEFGPEIDALNWDETFHVGVGELGTEAAPGYADRAMMRLTREISRLVEDYNRQHHRQIAFLTSDCLGAAAGPKFKAPYALVAHGTWQDSWCQPGAWSYGIFSNYRNVLWSCCWWPVHKWPWVDFGVRHFQAPVAVSNGWGDDTGFAEMTPDQRARVLELFRWRKDKPVRLEWFEQLPVFTPARR